MPQVDFAKPLYIAKAELFRALGHPARIRVLELLVERDQTVSELQAELGLESSALSQQLGILKRIGLVASQRKANTGTYRLTDPCVSAFLAAARSVLSATLDRSRQALKDLEAVAES
jgi:ArsR family transcriptional regulator